MIREHDIVVLTADVVGHGLKPGDIGTVVHVYPGGRAYEVEFTTFSGRTAALVTLEPNKIRAVAGNEIAHARSLATTS